MTLLALSFAPSSFARDDPKPLPSLVRGTDSVIFDDIGRNPQGWTVPADYFYVSSHHWAGPREISGGIRFGRFGVLSGGSLYTTWRAVVPLSESANAGGNTTVYDNHVSNLLTAPFEIKLPYVTFLLSGGNAPGMACVNLLVDPAGSNSFNAARAEVVRTATGRNDDMLEWVAFDVTNYVGKMAQFQVLDTSTAASGYITVDCVCQSPDTKGAVRVIAAPPTPVTVLSRAETQTDRIAGAASIKDGRLLIGGKPVDLQGLLSWGTGIEPGDAGGRRVELINGDAIIGNVSGMEDGKLILESAIFGQANLPLSDVAQALFSPGPSIVANPGTLIHENGSKIPGELTWIREDNISIKCALGQLPLPRGRVRAFVFAAGKPAQEGTTVTLTDGTTLSGDLAFETDRMVLTHATLGPIKLSVGEVARVHRRLSGVTPLAGLQGEVRERGGPISPPEPLRIEDASGAALRMFPRTVMRYALPKSDQPRRLRAALAPVANNRTPMTAHIRVGNAHKTYTVPPDSPGVQVEVDLGTATSFELVADAASTVSYPCGIEWRNAIVVGGATP